MYAQIVASFIFPCFTGAFLAGILAVMMKAWVYYERTQSMIEEENTDEVTATVLGKEHYTTRQKSGKHGHRTVDHYKVSYEFSAETADGTPCNVQVFGREIDGLEWDKLVEGRTLQVLYLRGRPGSCRMKDMVEKESQGSTIGCQIGCLVIFFLWILSGFCGYSTFMFSVGAISEDPGERQQIIIGTVTVFFVALCGCSVLCVGGAYSTRNNDSIYGGQVNVEVLPGSDSDNDHDNFVDSA